MSADKYESWSSIDTAPKSLAEQKDIEYISKWEQAPQVGWRQTFTHWRRSKQE